MSPCLSPDYDYEFPVEDVQLTITTTLSTLPSDSSVSSSLSTPTSSETTTASTVFSELTTTTTTTTTTTATTTTTVDEIVVVIITETVSASITFPSESGFVTSRSATSSSSSSVSTQAPSSSSASVSSTLASSLQAASSANQRPPGAPLDNNATSPTRTDSSLPDMSAGNSILQTSTPGHSVPTGAIVGVSIAGVLVTALVVIFMFLWRKREREAKAQRAIAGYQDRMRQDRNPLAPILPSDLQPNRAGGGTGVQHWTLRDSHVAAGDRSIMPPFPPNRAATGGDNYDVIASYSESQPRLMANQQYPFAPPVPVPQRPPRTRGDTLADAEYF
ncbi:hypothetical protein C8J57DRAFT_1270027 [Mycena rebaudengoi]|nr:hypothetical protein C8J57DRAFT_1270027 [Mycena rebaudengoi]